MDRIVRLNRLWSWLPAFRAVAEMEHVHEAAARLHLTPSTLSRAVRLLEDDVGAALFRRVGRSLELTDDGRELLGALREAMRRLDDALVAVGRRPTAPLRVAAEDALALAAVVDAIDPACASELIAAGDVAAQLLSGRIDVAFVTALPADGPVAVTRIGELGFSAVAAAGAAVRGFIDAPGLPWPPERARVVVLRVAGAAMALAACRAGAGVAMLPDGVTDGLEVVHHGGAPLARVTLPVYAVRRRPLDAVRFDAGSDAVCADAAGALVASVRARLAQAVRKIETEPHVARA